MTSAGMNLVMTVIGFAASTLFIVFICTSLICARKQLRLAHRSFQPPSRSNLITIRRVLHVLETPVLDNFPATKYSDDYFSSLESAQVANVSISILEFPLVLIYVRRSIIMQGVSYYLAHGIATDSPIARGWGRSQGEAESNLVGSQAMFRLISIVNSTTFLLKTTSSAF